jgi:hypothetical protein
MAQGPEEAKPMTLPANAPGLWIPFVNPIEVFPVSDNGSIQYQNSYRAICHRLTAAGVGILQAETTAPQRLVIGVDCNSRIFFLPGNCADFQPIGAGIFELQARFTTEFDPQAKPPKIEFIVEEEVESWAHEQHGLRKPHDEKRKHERVVYNEPVEVSAAPREHPAFALNISASGIALITTFPLKQDEVRVLKLPQADGKVKQVKTRIVRCLPIITGFYSVGGQFV